MSPSRDDFRHRAHDVGDVLVGHGGEQYILVPSGIGSAAQAIVAAIYPEVGEFPAGANLFAFKLTR